MLGRIFQYSLNTKNLIELEETDEDVINEETRNVRDYNEEVGTTNEETIKVLRD